MLDDIEEIVKQLDLKQSKRVDIIQGVKNNDENPADIDNPFKARFNLIFGMNNYEKLNKSSRPKNGFIVLSGVLYLRSISLSNNFSFVDLIQSYLWRLYGIGPITV